ncbi:MAG TPA: chromosomal replication initiator protein DnaA [Thermomicrobiales bacterium]|nr:chromosomal replication initiator protein DnaA [Thermomicrobiales bacterium]
MDLPAHQLWQAALSELQGSLSRSSFDNWIRPARLVEVGPDAATLRADNPQVAATLRNRFADDIGRVLSNLVGRPLEVVVTIDERPDSAAPNVPATRTPEPIARQLALTSNSGLNPRYIFDTYIVGSSNRFAHAASLAVADQPGSQYNPLYIWGGVGLGKTHLLHAIGHRALENNPDLFLTYVSSETFTNEVIASIRAQRMEEFREKYRGVDLLMIDDIQFIAGKESTQEEFFHTFNALHQSGKQVVISSDKPPKAISNLVERLRSRFEGGLIADVQLPDYEMRIAILSTKAEELGRTLPSDVVEYIAQRDQTNIRELEGALNKVLAYAQIAAKPLNIETAIEALTDATRTVRRDSLTPADIAEAVAVHFRIALADLRGSSRSQKFVVPRQIAMYLIRELTKASLVDVGEVLGGRDHTTIMHGIEKINREIETDATLRSHITQIREALLTG